jgi:PKD repeat protein
MMWEIHGLKVDMVRKMIVTPQSRLLGLVLVLVLIATYFTSTPAFAQSNPTSVVGISVYPTIQCIGVQCSYTGDDNINNSAVLEYRKTGSAEWLTGLPMAKVFGQLIRAGSIIGLSPNTQYDVRVTFSDSDGVTGTNPVMANATTRPDTYTLGSVHTYYVDGTNGLDTNSGDAIHPWKTIQHAADNVVAGDTVRIRAGTYYEAVEIARKSGSSYSAMISFVADDSNNKPVLNGANKNIETKVTTWTHSSGNIWYCSYSKAVNYVAANDVRLWCYLNSTDWTNRFAGISGGYFWDSSTNRLYVELIDGSNPNSATMHVSDHSDLDRDAGFRIFGSDYVRISGIEICYFYNGICIDRDDNASPYKTSSYGIANNNYIHHCNEGIEMIKPILPQDSPTKNWLIEDNVFYDNGPATWPWDMVKQGGDYQDLHEGAGVSFWYNGQGAVIRNNTTTGTFDGISIGDWSDGIYSSWVRDIDIYNNIIHYHGDDGVACTGTNLNTRIWGNAMYNTLTGVSSAPVRLGPCYIFRNVIFETDGAGGGLASKYTYKLGHALAQGKTFYFHNTMYNPSGTVNGWYDQDAPDSPGFDITAENNICVVDNWAMYLTLCSPGCVFDYNNIYTSRTGENFGWNGTRYSGWAAFKSGTGQESHGLNNSGTNCKLVDPANGNFQLQADSPLQNAGVIIPNMNDANSPWPYSGSAPDIGAFEYASNMPPPLGADFSTSPTQGIAGVTQFAFTDASSGGTPPYTYQWDFDNNGTWDSTAQNPTYAYSARGNYTVTLKVTDAAGNTNTKTKTGYIAVYNRGDANQDGNINSLDVTKVKRIIVGLDSPTPGADANGDGNVNALDITQIELIIAGY